MSKISEELTDLPHVNETGIAVDSDGELLVLVDGKLSGPAELVKAVKLNSLVREGVRLLEPHGEFFSADVNSENPFEALAALISVNPGRSSVLAAPSEVVEYLNGDTVEDEDSFSDENIEIVPLDEELLS